MQKNITPAINFFSESINYTLKHKTAIRSWITDAFKLEKKVPGNINFIFCSDKYLLKINKNSKNK